MKNGDEHTAEALHCYGRQVAQHAIPLQTPKGKEVYQYRALIKYLLFILNKITPPTNTYFLSVIHPKVMLPTMPLIPNMDMRKAASLYPTPTLRA